MYATGSDPASNYVLTLHCRFSKTTRNALHTTNMAPHLNSLDSTRRHLVQAEIRSAARGRSHLSTFLRPSVLAQVHVLKLTSLNLSSALSAVVRDALNRKVSSTEATCKRPSESPSSRRARARRAQ